jgi:steroid delta-isomerase-like uncharacterized protein
MHTNANKAIVRRFLEEAINKGQLDVADEVLDEDFVFRSLFGRTNIEGIENMKRVITRLRSTFEGLRFDICDEMADGDKVLVRFTVRGTHTGSYMGVAPTGKQVDYAAIDIFRLASGKIVEVWSLSDQLGLMQQLGQRLSDA